MLALMRKKALEEAQVKLLPPRLFCVPASVSGNCVVLPKEVREIVEEKENSESEHFFQIRKDAKTIPVVATSWQAPTNSIGLSSYLMKHLGLKFNDFVLFGNTPSIPDVKSMTVEVSDATHSKGVGTLNELISKQLRTWGCAEVGDQLKIDGMRLRIKHLTPSPAFFGAHIPEIKFTVKQRKQKVPEITASKQHTESARITNDFMRIIVPFSESGTLRVVAKTPAGRPASAMIYISEGDDVPTPEKHKWGGSNSVDCSFSGKTVYSAKIVGDPCTLHVSVLHIGQHSQQSVTKRQESLQDYQDYSQSILSYFLSREYVPSPSEVEARLPAGVDLSHLNCFESLLLIGKRPGSYFVPPHTAEWALHLRNRLASLSVYLRLVLAVYLPALVENPDFESCMGDLKKELSSASGSDVVLLLLRSLSSNQCHVRRNAGDILKWVGGEPDVEIID
eukprot:TRINITY_DN9920_c0_g1_i1.p1 TRINITY_DN9920_c0_g1~~TRINITY_DN9920_c0_g1_i1.p1  ORF type:complete len:449 (+),score=72.09 TRINITY_DN9920_c0_g1_i1:628-1974(+)